MFHFPRTIYVHFLVTPAILIKTTSYLLLNQASPLHLLLMSSSNDFNYYVIFVDHYTKYIGLYQLRRKLDVHSIFVTFKQLVENYFITTIKTLYPDKKSNFLALRSFLTTHGITHLTTPPYIPEHNGYFECRH